MIDHVRSGNITGLQSYFVHPFQHLGPNVFALFIFTVIAPGKMVLAKVEFCYNFEYPLENMLHCSEKLPITILVVGQELQGTVVELLVDEESQREVMQFLFFPTLLHNLCCCD